MSAKKCLLVVAGSWLVGVGLGTLLTRGRAVRGGNPVSVSVPVTSMTTEYVPILRLPDTRYFQDKERAEGPSWVLARDRQGKKKWYKTGGSFRARREYTDAVRAEEDRIRRMTSGQGTSINAGNYPGAPGDPEVRRAFAQAFMRLNPEPAERLAHFRWVAARGLNQVGWWAAFRQLERREGGWLVELKILPHLEERSGIWTTGDFCVERWFFGEADGRLTMVPFVHAHPHPGSLALD